MRSKCRFNGKIFTGFLIVGLSALFSCKKLVDINPPTNSITSSQVFADSANAEAAVAAIYTNMVNINPSFGSGAMTIFTGLSSDELLPFFDDGDLLELSSNRVLATNGTISNLFWTQPYDRLYQANAIIEGLQTSTGLSMTAKNHFIGEAKFFRAFFNFYLVNLFGDIPLLSSTNYKTNAIAVRSSQSSVYQQIISDLKDAQDLLPSDYSAGIGEKIRANRWAATALLSRVYLYTNDYANAAQQASEIINSNHYSLEIDLNNVFLKNSSEAILQWQINSTSGFYLYNATQEGYNLLPQQPGYPPFYYLTPQLINAFENGDTRRIAWVDSTDYNGVNYYFAKKYKIGAYEMAPNAPVTEYYMVLRLAEQYLIRAEAEAKGANGGVDAAVADLNIIRGRAGLPGYAGAADATSVLNAIYHERQIEFFAEWGHRWLDLKRMGRANTLLSSISYKQPWAGDYQLLYPVPPGELAADPNLVQNPGY